MADDYKPAGDPRELWNSPMHDLQTRLEIAAGCVDHWKAVSENMRRQRDELRKALAVADECGVPLLDGGRDG